MIQVSVSTEVSPLCAAHLFWDSLHEEFPPEDDSYTSPAEYNMYFNKDVWAKLAVRNRVRTRLIECGTRSVECGPEYGYPSESVKKPRDQPRTYSLRPRRDLSTPPVTSGVAFNGKRALRT